jgi:hypothetical protein
MAAWLLLCTSSISPRTGAKPTLIRKSERAADSVPVPSAWCRPARVGEELGLAEGVETALSAYQLTNVPTWAVLGAERLDRITLPPWVRRVIIFADNDVAGRDAAQAAAGRYGRCDGLEVDVRLPPHKGDDWNDVLLATRRTA